MGVITFSGGNVLAAVDPVETAAFYTGSVIAVTDPVEQPYFDIELRTYGLDAVDPLESASIDILSGLTVEIIAVDPKETASIVVYNGILVNIQAVDPTEEGLLDVLAGTVEELVAVDPVEAAVIIFSADTLAEMAATDPLEEPFFYIRELPITPIRKAIVMHLFNHAVSNYINFNFNSLFHFQGHFLGTNEQGVFLLGGDDDLGKQIQMEIQDGVRDLVKNGSITIPREAWLTYRSNDGMELDARFDEVADLPPLMFSKVASMIRETRAKFGRGIKARFLQWTIRNVQGSDCHLESLRILGDRIKRKTR